MWLGCCDDICSTRVEVGLLAALELVVVWLVVLGPVGGLVVWLVLLVAVLWVRVDVYRVSVAGVHCFAVGVPSWWLGVSYLGSWWR